jgi:hypothetical protein
MFRPFYSSGMSPLGLVAAAHSAPAKLALQGCTYRRSHRHAGRRVSRNLGLHPLIER